MIIIQYKDSLPKLNIKCEFKLLIKTNGKQGLGVIVKEKKIANKKKY